MGKTTIARKWLLLGAALLLLLSAMPAAAQAAEPPALTLSVSDSEPEVDEQISVKVKAEGLSDLYAYQLKLYYNAERLEFVAGSEVKGTSGFAVPAKATVAGTEAYVLYALTKSGNGTGINGASDLVTLTFKAKVTGEAGLSLRDVKLVDSELQEIQGPQATASVYVGGRPSTPGPSAPVTTQPPTPERGADTVVVDEAALSGSASGKVKVALKDGASKLELPARAADLLGSGSLVVEAPGIGLTIPSALLKQLQDTLPAGAAADGTIQLAVTPLDEAAAREAVAGAGAQSSAAVRSAGTIYEFSLSIQSKDGKSYKLTAFKEPIQLTFQAEAELDPRLSGVFYIGEDGKLEYVEGTFKDGVYEALVTHFSRYAVLEINKTYTDVPASHWASAAIKELAAKQIVSGTSETTFEPARRVTRAEFTSLLVRALKLDAAGASAYTDVPAGAWYAQDVATAAASGLVQGKSSTAFAPNDPITREEMTVLLMRAYDLRSGELASASGSAGFADRGQIAAWAVDEVERAAALGLIQGQSGNRFVPKGESTRAEAAQVIHNLLF